MDEDEDDVFRKGLQHWPPPHLQIKQTELAGRPAGSRNGMLLCRHLQQHGHFLYGNAELLVLAASSRAQPPDVVLRQNVSPMERPEPRPAQSVETLIGQKLQLIGDQFYQEHIMHHQRPQDPLWRRVATAVLTLLFGARENRR
ncbi:BCL2 modifying factor 1 [Danio rerio]|uniref:BCL2 modifying factor 1 n=1 Tax=Danio rerio TaxID=7955 RepID=Q0GKC7_DANRE|nr:BCL2 modifying factor 1 [Danio rerio]ABI18124.1 Bmf1 [Danio rerio]|eukprot:NP_001038689.1 bcl-2-modifying factor [Danio rerio]